MEIWKRIVRWNVLFSLILSIVLSVSTFVPATFAAGSYQGNAGVVQGTVTDENGGSIAGATVRLQNSTTKFDQTVKTDDQGKFVINGIPFNTYTLHVLAKGFQENASQVDVHSNIPLANDVTLKIGATSTEIDVNASANQNQEIDPDKVDTSTQLSGTLIQRSVGSAPSAGIQNTVARAPGAVKSENGRVFLRGQENGLLYVVDGVPISDSVTPTNSSGVNLQSVSSIEVSTGNISAEFGNRLGGVVSVNTPVMSSQPITGSFAMTGGSFESGNIGGTVGGHVGKVGFYVSASEATTQRYLDSVTADNFHNHGHNGHELFKLDYAPNGNDTFRASFNFGEAGFGVANRPFQQFAGQDQTISLNDNSQNASWQHLFSSTTLMNVAVYRRKFSSGF